MCHSRCFGGQSQSLQNQSLRQMYTSDFFLFNSFFFSIHGRMFSDRPISDRYMLQKHVSSCNHFQHQPTNKIELKKKITHIHYTAVWETDSKETVTDPPEIPRTAQHTMVSRSLRGSLNRASLCREWLNKFRVSISFNARQRKYVSH